MRRYLLAVALVSLLSALAVGLPGGRQERPSVRAAAAALGYSSTVESDALPHLLAYEEQLERERVESARRVEAAREAARVAAEEEAARQTEAARRAAAPRPAPSPVSTPVRQAWDGSLHAHSFLVCTRMWESDRGDANGNGLHDAGYEAYAGGGPYLGAYQFLQSTWDSTARASERLDLVGVDPRYAGDGNQDAMAWALYQMQGNRPWGGRC